MRGFAAPALLGTALLTTTLLTTVMTAVPAGPAFAQRIMSDINRVAIQDTRIRNPGDLVEVCNVMVFRKFGAPGPRYGGILLEMDREIHFREHNMCVMNKGQGYIEPGEARKLRHRPDVQVVAVPEPKPVIETRPAPEPKPKPAPAPETQIVQNTPRNNPPPGQKKLTRSQEATREAIIRDPDKLAEVCNMLVFRRYGQAAPLRGPRWLEMEAEHQARAQNACIMSKGRNY
jgi:hypothetical protein